MKATIAELDTNFKFLSELNDRSGKSCEFCGSDSDLKTLHVTPSNFTEENCVLACKVCADQLTGVEELDLNHWRCLQDSIWSEVESVQVASFRLLKKLENEGWASAILDQVFLDDELIAWAEASEEDVGSVVQKDSNGTILEAGDSVTLIKDLEVKGAGFTAKRGTVVKNISLTSNPEHIEGRVNGSQIVLKTCFLKKVTQ